MKCVRCITVYRLSFIGIYPSNMGTVRMGLYAQIFCLSRPMGITGQGKFISFQLVFLVIIILFQAKVFSMGFSF